jgi:hypothetical protein
LGIGRKEIAMIVKVKVKNPDVLDEAIMEAVTQEVAAMSLPPDESLLLIEARRDKAAKQLSKWWEYSEYVDLEFDLDAMTAKVIERK